MNSATLRAVGGSAPGRIERLALQIGMAIMFLLLGFGCHHASHSLSETQASVAGSTQAAVQSPPKAQLEMRCHYVQDMKYAADQASIDDPTWNEEVKSAILQSQGGHYDLFSHQGGGPGGAEWNSDGDIMILALLPHQANELTDVRLTLNDKLWEQSIDLQSQSNAALVSTTIPGTDWSRFLKPIRKGDHDLLYSPDLMESMGSQKNSPLGEGKILRIGISYRVGQVKHSHVRAFAVAYGE